MTSSAEEEPLGNRGPVRRGSSPQQCGLRIIQDPALFCFGMDAVLLSAYVQMKRARRGLDLGTGNGVPTINIPAPSRQMLPPNGVYFSRVIIGGKEFRSVSNIGVNPTVNQDSEQAVLNTKPVKVIETFIFDFNDDVYGDEVTVYFDHFSRGERKFRSKDELFEQIRRDCDQARAYHYDK